MQFLPSEGIPQITIILKYIAKNKGIRLIKRLDIFKHIHTYIIFRI